ncbi:MAG: 30S ribosomal protein S19 [Candidatus Micrarchaeota archaeon]|nr:30S ribosomal protein S19 [Candidatus Micrarchaeota archaeon]
MVRTFSFRGRSVEELQKLSNEEFSKLLKSRQRRAIKRMGVQYKQLIVKIEKAKKKGAGKTIRTHIREAVILPSWIGMKFAIYNGKSFDEINIAPEMMGHRLGEYAYTVKHVQHSAPGIRATRGSKFLAVK